jgi:hypothetical protein
VVALGGDKNHTQHKETGQKSRTEHEGRQCAMCLLAPSDRRIKGEEGDEMLKGNKLAISATEKEETTKDIVRRVGVP